jgi:hypothetical protein
LAGAASCHGNGTIGIVAVAVFALRPFKVDSQSSSAQHKMFLELAVKWFFKSDGLVAMEVEEWQ